MQTPMAQLSLRIRAVWSAPLLLALWTVQQLNFYFLLLLFISEKIHIINIDEHAYIKNSIQHCDGIAFLYKIYAVSILMLCTFYKIAAEIILNGKEKTHKTTNNKVRKTAMIRNNYNQVPHLLQVTKRESYKITINIA